ncbi:unnamed protein product [Sphagnum balticum]
MSFGSRKQDVNTEEDNGYQSLMDPTQATIPYASFSIRIVALMRFDFVGLQPGRQGTKAFFSPGGSSQGKMATEQYFKHVRPLQGSLSTMGATKSINTRYADTIRSQLLKRVQK